MSSVYLVVDYDYDGLEVMAVTADRALAEEYAKKHYWDVAEHEVLTEPPEDWVGWEGRIDEVYLSFSEVGNSGYRTTFQQWNKDTWREQPWPDCQVMTRPDAKHWSVRGTDRTKVLEAFREEMVRRTPDGWIPAYLHAKSCPITQEVPSWPCPHNCEGTFAYIQKKVTP